MLRVRDFYLAGMPSTSRGTNGPFRLIACHTTEGTPGVAGAEATARFMVSTASTRNASYHELWAWEGGDLHVLRIVPPTRAAHSVAPQPPPGPYEPDAWVRDSLGDKVRDPNMWVYAVSIAGRTSTEAVAYARDPAFLSHARQRLNDLGIARLAEHYRFNPRTRSDWGSTLTAALGGLNLPYETDVADIDTFKLETIRIDGGANIRSAPADTASILFQTASPSTALAVGSKNGYIAYWLDAQKRWAYTSISANVLSREPYTSGYTQADLDAALSNARHDGKAIQTQAVAALDNIALRAKADADAIRAKTIR